VGFAQKPPSFCATAQVFVQRHFLHKNPWFAQKASQEIPSKTNDKWDIGSAKILAPFSYWFEQTSGEGWSLR